MKAFKFLFSVVFLLMLASNVRSISHWSESRGVYDDICYLRQAHLFQRFGWHGLDTSLAHENDGYLAGKLRSINYPDWNDPTRAPCHTLTRDGSKMVMTPPPGTGFVLSLFSEGYQVIPLYTLANVLVAGFALYGLWRTREPTALALAATFGAVSVYFMINPTKASYSMAPTMVLCAFIGLMTARLFVTDDQPSRIVTAFIGLMLGLSATFRIANVLLSAGYFVFFGYSFLAWRTQEKLLQGITFGSAFLVGVLPVLVANKINSGHPLVSAYSGVDTQPPRLDLAVLQAYLVDTQFLLIIVVCIWTALLWRFTSQPGVRQLTGLVASNLVLNIAFFATHPIFTQYYTMPVSMLTLWTLLFTSIFASGELRLANPPGLHS